MENFKDFHDVLKENLESFEGDYDHFVDNGPDLFKLLSDMLSLSYFKASERLMIGAAISYFVISYDIIPEHIYGPYGYIDDIFISTYVIKEIVNEYGYDTLDKIWKGNGKLEDVVNLCYSKSVQILESNEIEEILNYSGLKE